MDRRGIPHCADFVRNDVFLFFKTGTENQPKRNPRETGLKTRHYISSAKQVATQTLKLRPLTSNSIDRFQNLCEN